MTDRRRRTYPAPRGLPSANALSSQPRAVVVGAGIAGLAAATGLAERGISVDVIEREEYLGGRVGAWTEQYRDIEVGMNRGFHAFFRQYYNLRALLRRVDPKLTMLIPVDDYPLIDGAGRRDSFRGLPRTPPWNALAFALRSPTFRLGDLARIDARAAAPLAAVSLPDIYNRLDHIDAETFLKSLNFPEAARPLPLEVSSGSSRCSNTWPTLECDSIRAAPWQASAADTHRHSASTPIPMTVWTRTPSCWPPMWPACSELWRRQRDLATTCGGHGSGGCAPRPRSWCIACGSTALSPPIGRRFSAPPVTNRSTTSASLTATNAKPPTGPGNSVALLSNYIRTRCNPRSRSKPC